MRQELPEHGVEFRRMGQVHDVASALDFRQLGPRNAAGQRPGRRERGAVGPAHDHPRGQRQGAEIELLGSRKLGDDPPQDRGQGVGRVLQEALANERPLRRVEARRLPPGVAIPGDLEAADPTAG